jgi:hypothetical protein
LSVVVLFVFGLALLLYGRLVRMVEG